MLQAGTLNFGKHSKEDVCQKVLLSDVSLAAVDPRIVTSRSFSESQGGRFDHHLGIRDGYVIDDSRAAQAYQLVIKINGIKEFRELAGLL